MSTLAVAAFCVLLLVPLSLSPVSEFLAALRKDRRLSEPPLDDSARLLFLVPAHDEEQMIAACVRSLLEMDYPVENRAVVVVADNCSDCTADLADAAGALCLRRKDEEHPGKPHALAWALRQLPVENWDACVVVDADTTVDPDFARALASRQPLDSKCVQAYFDVSNEDESWLTRLGSLLARVRYERHYPLKQAAGLNCPLTGNGMCIGTGLLVEEGWPAFSLTENWELYARYTADGVPIEYERRARLYSYEASALSQASTQRKRWLAGRMWVVRHFARSLLGSRKIGVHQKVDAFSELTALSPILHLAAAAGVAAVAALALPGHLGVAIAVASLSTLLPITVKSLAVLRTHPRRWRLAGSLLLLPGYALWRVFTAVATVETFRQGRWVKTERV